MRAIGCSRGGLTTKIVALIDALGNLAGMDIYSARSVIRPDHRSRSYDG